MDESRWWPAWFPSTGTHQHLSSPASKPAGRDLCPRSSPGRPHTVIRRVCVPGRRGPHCPDAEPDLGSGSTARAADLRALGSPSALALPSGDQRAPGCLARVPPGEPVGVPQRQLCPILLTGHAPSEKQVRENGGSFQAKLRAQDASWAGKDVGSDHPVHFLADRSQARGFLPLLDLSFPICGMGMMVLPSSGSGLRE